MAAVALMAYGAGALMYWTVAAGVCGYFAANGRRDIPGILDWTESPIPFVVGLVWPIAAGVLPGWMLGRATRRRRIAEEERRRILAEPLP